MLMIDFHKVLTYQLQWFVRYY